MQLAKIDSKKVSLQKNALTHWSKPRGGLALRVVGLEDVMYKEMLRAEPAQPYEEEAQGNLTAAAAT